MVRLNIGVLSLDSREPACLQLSQTLRGWLPIRVPRAFEVIGGVFTRRISGAVSCRVVPWVI